LASGCRSQRVHELSWLHHDECEFLCFDTIERTLLVRDCGACTHGVLWINAPLFLTVERRLERRMVVNNAVLVASCDPFDDYRATKRSFRNSPT
jgi:hypothetical protein